MDSSLVFYAVSAAAVLLVTWALRVRVLRREAADAAQYALAQADELHLPPSLHPVIDPAKCIGSLSCVKACPEGDILGVTEGVARLVEGARCIGHGRCALECPVGAIRLVFGSSERGVDLPEVDENFQSSRPGVFIVGELGGMGLIKNAMAQGLEAGAFIGDQLATKKEVDVVIVGAGPAGIATAVALEQAGARFRLLEQGQFGGTIASYPRQKLVMNEPIDLPEYGKFGKRSMTKETLLEGLRDVCRHFSLKVEEGAKVSGISGEDGAFVVHGNFADIRCQKVVLAIGRRGTPRKLEVQGESLRKVTYALTDPEQYVGKKVLVVGGGDSAVEAAVALGQAGARCVISYRRPEFGRCRAANREALATELAAGSVKALLSSEVLRISDREVTLKTSHGEQVLPNDFVIVCAGGELPLPFLKQVGVDLVRHRGEKAQLSPAARPWRAKGRGFRPTPEMEASRTRRLNRLLIVLGATIVLGLTIQGWSYYLLSAAERRESPLHEALRPSGPIGHWIGLVASAVMLLNFVYPLRKRLGFLKGTAPITRWLSFHVFVGILSPTVIAFHAAFQSNNAIATATYFALLIVVGTGLTGRFVYGMIPSVEGRITALAELRGQLERTRAQAEGALAGLDHVAELRRYLRGLANVEAQAGASVATFFVSLPENFWGPRLAVRRLRFAFDSEAVYAEYRDSALRLAKMRLQIQFHAVLRRFLSWWRLFHVVLAVFLVGLMAVHIGISLYLGYGWDLF